MDERDSSGQSSLTPSMPSGSHPSHFNVLFHRGSHTLQNPSQVGYSGSLEAPAGVHAPAAMRPIPTNPMSGHAFGPDSLTAMITQPMAMGMGRTEPLAKRKRGRPRKYVEGVPGSMALALAPVPGSMSPSKNRGRGRGRGSGKKQQLAALGSAGQGFTPHVIMIAAGEDVASKIMSFSQIGPRAICVLSANGAISNVTLRQPATSGGTVTYEGRFEILSLTGSFLLTEGGGTRSRTGGLSVSLAGQDGRVVGGSVAGLLMAASPVQVIVGSFICESRKSYPRAPDITLESSAGEGMMFAEAMASGVMQPSPKPETYGPNSGSPGSPLHHHQGAASSTITQPQAHHSLGFTQNLGWTVSDHYMPDSRRNTDISMSLPGG
ncbi:hypothetical protein O6H91_15G065300 [Diphasiastrum complanatum]|nr:hypothetical protein O6H91_15G065300 [Diphasiastrum complanatum]KAJ7529781.1 hypothetical protein O6H91_15G065300 [Diphasiastrum complanatum]KAJ7529782.1 hypothetical protein O6H91_15G065300 [Diphasiastrum complanatum]KAJ7529783.1 hypothetical protein O6H91_15G065300 [Diphasiastrum complanatum]KAJ7529785.1 hypothetical protein O6H91_15G065300 [Diphasiastrum complanatum]